MLELLNMVWSFIIYEEELKLTDRACNFSNEDLRHIDLLYWYVYIP